MKYQKRYFRQSFTRGRDNRRPRKKFIWNKMRRSERARGRAKKNDGRVAFFHHLKLRGKELRQAMKETEPAENQKEIKKHLYNLWSLTGGEIGEEPPEEVMEEWR